MPDPVVCPHCGVPTSDLKQLRVWNRFICALFFVRITERVETACPACMKQILDRSLSDNLITANIAWPAMALLYIPRYMAVRRPGPSMLVAPKIAILHDVTARPSSDSMWRSIRAALLIVVGICGLFMAFDRHGEWSENATGWVCTAISVGMFTFLIWRSRRRPER
jgi:hypothetical protein